MTPEIFDRTRLSRREDAILEAAIEGMTDIQIALSLSISPSTVNSYWVRIRGKLGQLSRTELVALALKAKARFEMDEAQTQLAGLREDAKTHNKLASDYANVEIFRAALDALPEAMFVSCHLGLIRYANTRLTAMFGYAADELADQPFSLLVPLRDRKTEWVRVLEYLEDPRPMRIGIGRVVYGQRKDGSLFRIVLLLDARLTSTGPIVSCVVRDFSSEFDLRRDFASSSGESFRNPAEG